MPFMIFTNKHHSHFNSILHSISLSLSLFKLQSRPSHSAMNSNSSPTKNAVGAKTSYKFWVLFAVLLLALWSMLTGSVTLRWSVSDDFRSATYDELDILEVEEREKVVRHMWDLYGQSGTSKLPRFWREAFEAGYESLVSDAPGVRDSAFSEIAKMSIFSVAVDPLPYGTRSPGTAEQSRKMGKPAQKKKEATKRPKKLKKEKETTSNLGAQVDSKEN